ncbi:MAG: CRTAC1 family protein, partial [Bryobacteraceae bacterium]
DVSKASGITAPGERYGLSVTTLDYDHDGWPDIYVAVDSQASILYRNKGDGTFQDTGVETGVAYSEDGREQAGMGTSAADYDGDGLLDLVKTNFIDDTPNLYRNNGDGSFTENTVPAGLGRTTKFLGWGTAFTDYDNDGWPDVFMVNGHVYPDVRDASFNMRRLLYRNTANGRFADVSMTSGDAVKAEFSSRGVVEADFDNDGNMDLLVTNMNEKPSLLHNNGTGHGHWITLRLEGTKSNRSAIGARVTVYAGTRRLVNEVRSGSTFMSQSDLRLHFGLGALDAIEKIEVEWPSGPKGMYHAKVDQIVSLVEGK